MDQIIYRSFAAGCLEVATQISDTECSLQLLLPSIEPCTFFFLKKVLTVNELAWTPILVLLLVNLRSGMRANGSSNDKIICNGT